MSNSNTTAITNIQERLLTLLLHDSKLFYQHSNRLRENLFVDVDLNRLFIAYKEVLQKGISPSAASVSKESKGKRDYDVITSIMMNRSGDGTDLETCLQFLEDEQRSMKITKFNEELLWAGQNSNFDIIPRMTRDFLDSYANISEKAIKTIKDQVRDFIAYTETVKDGISGIHTGFTMFDKFSGGLQPGTLTVIAGGTSQGKTTAALAMLYDISVIQKIPSALFSLEMSEAETIARLLAVDTGQPSKDLMRGKVDYLELNKLLKLHSASLIIDDCYSISLDYLLGQMRYYHARYGTKFFVVDYLQMIKATMGNRSANREQETGEICRALKGFARETGSAVVLGCQVSRGKDRRPTPEPRLSDMRDSGQIEESADNVLLIYRPEYYNLGAFEDGANTKGKAEFILAKGRSIGIMKFRVDFLKEIPTFMSESIRLPKFEKYYEQTETSPF